MSQVSNREGGGLFGGLLLAGLIAAVFAASASAATAPENVVATARGAAIAVYRSEGAKKPYLTLHSLMPGQPPVLLVRMRATGWEQVYLPMRPNGSRGWVKDSEVRLTNDPYFVHVSLGKHRITVWNGNRVILKGKVGVGRSTLPTPRGVYFIATLLKQPDPNGEYGPYAFGLSAFSNVLQSFGGGPGEIGIHGTNYPAGLGTNVSHGCIRISNATITKLAYTLPLGTPVLISP